MPLHYGAAGGNFEALGMRELALEARGGDLGMSTLGRTSKVCQELLAHGLDPSLDTDSDTSPELCVANGP